MSVRSAQAITKLFTTRAFATGAATDATGTPTGTLYVNGTADAASVTVTNITTGLYKAAVTLPTLAVGDIVDLRINATVSAVTDNAIIWSDTKDLALDSSYRPGIDWANVGSPTTTLALTGTTIGTLTTYTGNTPQTGDSYAIVNSVTFGNAQLVRATTPANTLDVSATGEAGLDFNNIKDATGAHTLTNITVPLVTTVTNQLTAAQVATGVWQDTTPGDFTVASSVGKSVFTGRAPGDVLGGLICNNAAAQLSALAVNGSTTLNTLSVASTTTLTGAVSAPAGIAANLTGNIIGNITGDLIGDVTGGVTLADGVVHGGSTATMTLQQLTLDNSSGTAFVINSDTADGINISAANDGIFVSSVRDGLSLSSGRFGVKISATSSGIDLSCGGVGLDISSGNVAINGANGIQADLLGAVTNFSPAALAGFFTTDTTKVYADAVTGSVVKETASGGSGGGLTQADVRQAVGLATANLDTQLGGIQSDTNDIQTRLPTALDGSGNILANVQTFDGSAPVQTLGKLWVLDGSGNAVAPSSDTTTIIAKTNLIPVSPAAVGSAMTLTSGERDSIAAALLALADGVETDVTVKQTLRLLAAGVAGKRSNCGTTSEQYDAVGSPGTARIVGNLNSSGDGTPTLTP